MGQQGAGWRRGENVGACKLDSAASLFDVSTMCVSNIITASIYLFFYLCFGATIKRIPACFALSVKSYTN